MPSRLVLLGGPTLGFCCAVLCCHGTVVVFTHATRHTGCGHAHTGDLGNLKASTAVHRTQSPCCPPRWDTCRPPCSGEATSGGQCDHRVA